MVLEAELFNVHPVKGGVQAQVYGAQNEKRSSVMFVVFKDEWRMQLEQAPPGSKLSFKAKIRVTHSGQHFWEADLLRLDLPADDRPGA
ncbi:MAG TPA: hypothetical protein VN814_11310 [Caulobacteraceae bacterium]|nr:hypothetical protein [Caulobacteraceae bacterium]